MTDRLLALRVFARVARTQSFSRAARELGLSQPSISRIAAELEREVGAVLLTRTTRVVKLTDVGADYLARVEPILSALEEADHVARGTGELRGTLRVALSSSFGVREVIPRLPAFMNRHPELRLDLMMSDYHLDLVTEGVDLALRFGALDDSTAAATARRLGASPRVLAASPGYLQHAGPLAAPTDLTAHSVITSPGSGGSPVWVFTRDGRTVPVRIEGRMSVSSNEGSVAVAIAGIGVVSTSLWACRAEIESGALRRVLPDWELGLAEVHAVFPAGRAAKPSARAFADHLATELRA